MTQTNASPSEEIQLKVLEENLKHARHLEIQSSRLTSIVMAFGVGIVGVSISGTGYLLILVLLFSLAAVTSWQIYVYSKNMYQHLQKARVVAETLGAEAIFAPTEETTYKPKTVAIAGVVGFVLLVAIVGAAFLWVGPEGSS